jgi:hypothetical protein
MFAESLDTLALGKAFFLKKIKLFAESQPNGLSAKKADPLTAPFLRRGPRWLSAKKALPIGFLPGQLCRELLSAKPLPRV